MSQGDGAANPRLAPVTRAVRPERSIWMDMASYLFVAVWLVLLHADVGELKPPDNKEILIEFAPNIRYVCFSLS